MLTWHQETRSLATLTPYAENPRRMGKKALANLKRSLQEDGFHQRLLIDTDGTVIGGHSRLRAMQELGWKEVEVLVPSRKLTAEEFDRINIRDNLPFGDFDFDMLANKFDVSTLMDWGMEDLPFPPKEEDEEPVPTPQDESPAFSVVIACKDEDHAKDMVELLEGLGFVGRVAKGQIKLG